MNTNEFNLNEVAQHSNTPVSVCVRRRLYLSPSTIKGLITRSSTVGLGFNPKQIV